ncbi:alpha/beta hydrolase [Nocardioides ferulae]|uniref:alpha/beta hydrolase n=1 Tax=Nocardioides ferulae TaxID=2340821 RepID=UPI000EB180A4|nr:prolyl oligopeptidase family serine peptidase [Nocardioides ferulae]
MTGPDRRRTVALALSLVLTLFGAACADAESPDPGAGVPTEGFEVVPVEYAAGLTEDLYLPEDVGEGTGGGRLRHAPLVVLVPGGSWTTADPGGLAGLAASLAVAGLVAAPARIRAAVDDDVVYPTPVEDVLCAVAAAVDRARAEGFAAGPVAVLGHSSGAHLAALAVLAVDDYSPDCEAPAVAPDALVGLAGPYDIAQVPEMAGALLGSSPDDDPATWEAANPVRRADLRPDVPVLLLHGEADDVVPADLTSQFAQALEDAGHPTTVELVPDVDHLGLFAAVVAGEPVATWLLDLAR